MPRRRRRFQVVKTKSKDDDTGTEEDDKPLQNVKEAAATICNEDTSLTSKTIESLPEELFLQICSYLKHGDRLSVRLVSKQWNKALSNWVGFNNTAIFLVKGGTDGRSILKQTRVPWKKLRLEKFRLNEKGHGSFTLPQLLVNTVTSLEFSKSIVSWEGFKQIMIQFSAIDELKIIQCKRRRKEALSPVPLHRMTRANKVFQSHFENTLKNITSLTLELRRISDMIFYIAQFNQHLTSLVKFSLKEVYDGVEIITPEIAGQLLKSLFLLIFRSSSSLKSISIHLLTLSIVNRFFPEVLQVISELKVLDLTQFEVRHFATEPLNSRDMMIFSEFLSGQKNMMGIRFPMPGDIPMQICRNTMLRIPKTVSRIHITNEKYLQPNFLDLFTGVRQLGVDFEMRQYLLSGKKYPNLISLEMQRGVLATTVSLITESFPNLVHLNLNGNCDDVPPIDDRCLQTISQNLKMIRSLILGVCSRITDFGVTGVRKEYCEKMFKSRAICLEPKMEIAAEEIIGSPLSSLKGLTHLVFSGATAITDVGIYYGFRFKELRSLNLRNNADISDWGLDWLGKLNPNLEEIFLGCGPWVTSGGLNRLRSRLRRIKRRNCVFVWPNQEYYSSDESYAMESDDENYAIVDIMNLINPPT